MVQELNEETFQKNILQSKKPIIVDFWAEWCAPCKILSPIFEELEKEMNTKIDFAKINVDKFQIIAQENDIRGIPCLIIFQKGKEADRIIGLHSKEEMKKIIENAIGEY